MNMPDTGPETGGTASLIDRAKAILLQPKETWPKIAEDTVTTGDLLRNYAVPLAAIGPVASFIGGQVFGYGAFGISYRPGFMGALGTMVATYVLSLIAIFVLAAVANFLAPKFGGKSDNGRAFKLVVFTMTAGWIAGVFGLIPSLMFLSILGLYGIYLFYTGAPVLMGVPQDKAGGYTAATFVVAIVLYFIAMAVMSLVAKPFSSSSSSIMSQSGKMSSGSVSVPGLGSIDVGKLEQTAKRMEDAASGKAKPADVEALQGLLPDSIAGFSKISTERTAIGGMGNVEASYAKDDHNFKLKIMDTNAIGALAGMGLALGMEQASETADGYERTGTVKGRIQTEKWSNSSSRGKFGVMMHERFMVEAEGHVPSIDVLKGAVAKINERKLAALAK